MNDREMLEWAARAIGRKVEWVQGHALLDNGEYFSPLTDDGDALRLAVRLQLGIEMQFDSVVVFIRSRACVVETHYRQDVEAATRRAIVRAAAEIGQAMEQNNA